MHRQRNFFFLSGIFLLLIFGGCGTGGYLITKSQLAQIKIGESTKKEVQILLGKPKHIDAADASKAKQEIWTYHLAKYASAPHTGIPPIGVSAWPITKNRPRPTVIKIAFTPSNVVTLIQELPRK